MRSIIRTFSTLRARLVAISVGSILAAVALFAVATLLLVNHELRSTLDADLRQRAENVAQLAVLAPAVLTEPGALESPVSGRQIAVEVIDAQGRPIARSLSLGAQLLPEDALARSARIGGRTGYESISIAGRPFRIFAAPIARAGGPAAGGAVLVASDTADISNTVHELALALALSALGAALVAALAAAVLTGRGLAPLRRLAVAGREIERTADPARRLPDVGAADEIGQLTGVLNRMLEALEQARAGERRFLADASHELRTPVTALLGNVEYAARHGANPDVLADLRRDAQRLARLVDDLLVLERAASPASAETDVIELDALVRALAAEYQRELDLRELVPIRVRADPESLGRAVRNLIDNALAHGPAEGRVTVALAREGGRALLTVSDEGSGPDPVDGEHLFERFWRGRDAAGRPGSGLGLSIVAAIAVRHGGRVTVDGAAFTIDLPTLPG